MDPAQLVPQKTPPPQIIMNYPFAVTAIALFGVCGVLGILYFHPAADNTQLIVTLLGFLGLAFGQLVNNIKTDSAVQKTEETHLLVNSQMAELKKTIAELERAKGVVEGALQERENQKERADKERLKEVEQVIISAEARKTLDIVKRERESQMQSDTTIANSAQIEKNAEAIAVLVHKQETITAVSPAPPLSDPIELKGLTMTGTVQGTVEGEVKAKGGVSEEEIKPKKD